MKEKIKKDMAKENNDFKMDWNDKLYVLLKTAYDIADEYDNPFSNDAGGAKFCLDVKVALGPLIDHLENIAEKEDESNKNKEK